MYMIRVIVCVKSPTCSLRLLAQVYSQARQLALHPNEEQGTEKRIALLAVAPQEFYLPSFVMSLRCLHVAPAVTHVNWAAVFPCKLCVQPAEVASISLGLRPGRFAVKLGSGWTPHKWLLKTIDRMGMAIESQNASAFGAAIDRITAAAWSANTSSLTPPFRFKGNLPHPAWELNV
jgi:hypothetical protein